MDSVAQFTPDRLGHRPIPDTTDIPLLTLREQAGDAHDPVQEIVERMVDAGDDGTSSRATTFNSSI